MPWNPRPPINGKSPRKREVYITEKFDSTTSTWPRPAFILSRQICLHGAASTTLSLIILFYVTVPRVSTGHRSYSQMLRPLWTFSANHRQSFNLCSSNRLFSRWTLEPRTTQWTECWQCKFKNDLWNVWQIFYSVLGNIFETCCRFRCENFHTIDRFGLFHWIDDTLKLTGWNEIVVD